MNVPTNELEKVGKEKREAREKRKCDDLIRLRGRRSNHSGSSAVDVILLVERGNRIGREMGRRGNLLSDEMGSFEREKRGGLTWLERVWSNWKWCTSVQSERELVE